MGPTGLPVHAVELTPPLNNRSLVCLRRILQDILDIHFLEHHPGL